jgi:hypothetical protein
MQPPAMNRQYPPVMGILCGGATVPRRESQNSIEPRGGETRTKVSRREKAMARSSFLAQNLEVVRHSDATSDWDFKRSPLLLIEPIQLAAQKRHNLPDMIRRVGFITDRENQRSYSAYRAGDARRKEVCKTLSGGKAPEALARVGQAIRRLGLTKSAVAYLVNAGAMRTMRTSVSIRQYCRTIACSATCGWQPKKFEQMTNTNIREA